MEAFLGDGMIIVTSVESNLQIVVLMKNALVAFMLLLSLDICAQGGLYDPQNELRGNGKPVQLTKPAKPFKEIEIKSFPAEIMIDAGAKESVVAVTIDENLRPLLKIDDEGGKLTLSFEHPQGKAFWINSNIINITIKTPELKGLTYRSNSKLVVSNLHGESLDLINQANATVTLQGSIKTMNLTNLANGNVNAQKLTAEKINVVSRANSNVRVYAKDVSVINTGFGTVVNVADSSQKINK